MPINKSSRSQGAALSKRMLIFLEHQSVSCKNSTLTNYKQGLKHFHTFLKLTLKTNTILKSHIHKLKRSHIESLLLYINDKNLVPYTKVNYLLQVKLYLIWEVEQNNLNPKTLDALDRKYFPKVPEYLPRPLSAENDRKLIGILKNSRSPYAHLFLLLRYTGLRISDLINLPWNCVIANDKNEKYLKVPPGKMNLERLVPLSDEAVHIIDTIKSLYPIRLNRCDKSRLIGLEGSVASVRGFLDTKFRKIIGNMADQDKPVTFHRLRHTYGTSLMTAGVSIVSIMKLLGHRRIEMSLRYAKITPSHLRNEFLKAVHIIENQVGIDNTKPSLIDIDPPEIMRQLLAFIRKTDPLPPKQTRTLLQRLARLKRDLDLIDFKQNPKMKPPG